MTKRKEWHQDGLDMAFETVRGYWISHKHEKTVEKGGRLSNKNTIQQYAGHRHLAMCSSNVDPNRVDLQKMVYRPLSWKTPGGSFLHHQWGNSIPSTKTIIKEEIGSGKEWNLRKPIDFSKQMQIWGKTFQISSELPKTIIQGLVQGSMRNRQETMGIQHRADGTDIQKTSEKGTKLW